MESQSSPKKTQIKNKNWGWGLHCCRNVSFLYTESEFLIFITLNEFLIFKILVETMCVPIVPFDILYIHYVFRIYHAFYA